MIFIVAPFLHEAREAYTHLSQEELIKPGEPWKYLYAPYLLSGFKSPKVYLTHDWQRNKSIEEVESFTLSFTAKSARLIHLTADLEIEE